MDKKEIINRLKLAAQQYISNQAILSSVIALLTGHEAHDIPWLQYASPQQTEEIKNFVSAVRQYDFIENFEIFKERINKLKKIIQEIDSIPIPSPLFKLIIFSGPSAVGKDTLVSLLQNYLLNKGEKTEILTKYTTRKKRPTDHKYYNFVTDKQFKFLIQNNKILFPYYKRKHKYGFSKDHLFKASSTSIILFAVFTEFEMLPKAKIILEYHNFHLTTILLHAPEEHLIHRSWFRSLPEEDVRARINSIKRDIAFLRENKKLINEVYDYVIYNGDDRAKMNTLEELKKIINNLN